MRRATGYWREALEVGRGWSWEQHFPMSIVRYPIAYILLLKGEVGAGMRNWRLRKKHSDQRLLDSRPRHLLVCSYQRAYDCPETAGRHYLARKLTALPQDKIPFNLSGHSGYELFLCHSPKHKVFKTIL